MENETAPPLKVALTGGLGVCAGCAHPAAPDKRLCVTCGEIAGAALDEMFDGADGEPECLVCGGEGLVDGSDHLDWDEDGYNDYIDCTSCHGTGLAKDMTWC